MTLEPTTKRWTANYQTTDITSIFIVYHANCINQKTARTDFYQCCESAKVL
ncbi:hypothetical protein RP300_00805 [Oligella urethralis]|nr:hypothetical protein RP300_00805 [Oligella urethralis]